MSYNNTNNFPLAKAASLQFSNDGTEILQYNIMSDPFLYYNGKIESELELPEENRNKDKLAHWRAELAKLTGKTSIICSPFIVLPLHIIFFCH